MSKRFLSMATLVCAMVLLSQPLLASKRSAGGEPEDQRDHQRSMIIDPRANQQFISGFPLINQLQQQFNTYEIQNNDYKQQISDYKQQIGDRDTIINTLELSTLNLKNTKLSCFPESFCLASLTSLNLENCELSDLPDSISRLTNLTQLNLDSNNLRELPASFSTLTALTDLDLSYNNFNPFPQVVCTLTNLTKLKSECDDEGCNTFESIPADVGNLQKLTHLHFEWNQVKHLPSTFERLTNLTELKLHSNELEIVPACLIKLPKLELLLIHGNEAIDAMYGPAWESDVYYNRDIIHAFLQYDRLVTKNKKGDRFHIGFFLLKELAMQNQIELPKDVLHHFFVILNQLTQQEIQGYYQKGLPNLAHVGTVK